MKSRIAHIICLLFFITSCLGQGVMLSESVQIDGVNLFPIYGSSSEYYYLPNVIEVAQSNGEPKFSFLTYTVDGSPEESIFTIELEYKLSTDLELLESKLRSKKRNENIRIIGCMPFTEARYFIVSSLVDKQALSINGVSSIFPNQPTVINTLLQTEQSKIFKSMLNMQSPDLTIVFDLAFEGVSFASSAKITVDWEEVRKQKYYESRIGAFFVNVDIKKSFDKLSKAGFIKIEQVGTSGSIDALVDLVYNRLMDAMFKPVPLDSLSPIDNNFIEDNESTVDLAKRALSIGYHSQHIRKTDIKNLQSTFLLTGRDLVEKSHLINYNVGSILKKHYDDPRYVNSIPIFKNDQERTISFKLNKKFINQIEEVFVDAELHFKKKNPNNKETNRIISLDSLKNGQAIELTYPRLYDQAFEEWSEYDYKVVWDYGSGKEISNEWLRSNSNVQVIKPPKVLSEIFIMVDKDALLNSGCSLVRIKSYPSDSPQLEYNKLFKLSELESSNVIKAYTNSNVENQLIELDFIKHDSSVNVKKEFSGNYVFIKEEDYAN